MIHRQISWPKTSLSSPAQFAAGERDEVPFAIMIGGDELRAGLVTLRSRNGSCSMERK